MSTLKSMPTTADELFKVVQHGQATIGNNMRVWTFMDDPYFHITLHVHEIVQVSKASSEAVRVRHCGYVTATTRDRIKRFLPNGWNVRIQQGVMYLGHRDNDWIELEVYGDQWSLWLCDVDKGLVMKSEYDS